MRSFRTASAMVMLVLCGCAYFGSSKPRLLILNFDSEVAGQLARGWTQASIGEGKGIWKVLEVGGTENRVLAQLSEGNPNKHFNTAVLETLKVSDVDLEVSIKAVSGKHDQGGGLVWRYQDAANYYVARFNPLETNVVAYKMESGVRTDLPLIGKGRTYGVKVTPVADDWQQLGVSVRQEVFIIYLNGLELFRVMDGTFTNPGRVGVWTKADAVTWFDNLSIRLSPAS